MTLKNMDAALGPEFECEAQRTSMVVLVGATGAGKSHFINAIVPGACATSARLNSCTQQPAAIYTIFDGKPLVLIDTPGFNDTRSRSGRSDSIVLSEIARLIAVQSAMGVKMRGILYLHDILSARMTGEAVRQLELLQHICGEDCWSHVTFVTTKWPDGATQSMLQLGTKESDLRRIYWRPMLRKKSKMFRFDDTSSSAETIVRSLMQQDPVTFALQREMDAGKLLADTTAGRFVVDARQRDERRQHVLRKEVGIGSRVDATDDDELEGLEDSIENRKKTEAVLVENVQVEVEKDLKTRLKELGREHRPTVASIISMLIGLSSFAINLVTMLV